MRSDSKFVAILILVAACVPEATQPTEPQSSGLVTDSVRSESGTRLGLTLAEARGVSPNMTEEGCRETPRLLARR